jgi:hypothetical protein
MIGYRDGMSDFARTRALGNGNGYGYGYGKTEE